MFVRRATPGRSLARWILALSLALTVLSVVPANAAAPTFTASLSPGSAGAGAATSFTLSVSSDQGVLQSLSAAAPAGFFVGSASSSSGNASVSGSQTVNVTGLKISGSAVLTVTINAWPACTPGSHMWNVTATQKGGTPYVPQTFTTSVTSSTSCFLSFGTIGSQVKNSPFSLLVTVKRANGTTDTTYTGPVSLTIEVDPGIDDASLTGGGPATPSAGVATFGGATLTQSGTAYVLEACSPTVNNVTTCPATGLEDGLGFLSGQFTVFDSFSDCGPAGCSNTGNGVDVVDATVTAPGNSGHIGVGIWKVPVATGVLADLDCPGYEEITTEVVSFEYTGAGTKIATDTISAEAMKLIADQGVSHLETCFASEESFPTKPGTPAATFVPTLGLWVGLLPDCPTHGNLNAFAPCTISRRGGGGGTGEIVYVARAGDPAGHH